MGLERIVDAAALGREPDAANFWRSTVAPIEVPQVDGEQSCDIAVVGGGLTGISAALRLTERGASVTVIDAEAPGWGASGRNGGFCCLGGSALSDDTIQRRYGRSAAEAYFRAERMAVDHVAQTLDVYEIDGDRHSEGGRSSPTPPVGGGTSQTAPTRSVRATVLRAG